MDKLNALVFPMLALLLLLCAAWKRLPAYELFVTGAREGLHVAVSVLPNLAVMLIALQLLDASGCMKELIRLLAPFLTALGLPAEVAPLAIMRPMSGAASLGLLEEILRECGADSRAGLVASTMMGSTETIFYTLCVYLSAVGRKRSGYAVPCALLGSLLGMIVAGACY